MEIWKDIPGFEGQYQISNEGNIRNLSTRWKREIKAMNPSKHHTGYLVITLGHRPSKTFLVHQLVANAFIPNADGKTVINHIDGNKENNHVENLEWVTYKENTEHAIRTGLRNPHNTPKKYGKDHYSSKAVLQYDPQGNFIKKWDCQSDVSRSFGVTPGAFSNAVDSPTKLYRGYMWVSYDGTIQQKIQPSKSRFAPKKVFQYSLEGEFIREWDDAKIAAGQLNLLAKGIKDCCRGRQKSHGGYIWKF